MRDSEYDFIVAMKVDGIDTVLGYGCVVHYHADTITNAALASISSFSLLKSGEIWCDQLGKVFMRAAIYIRC